MESDAVVVKALVVAVVAIEAVFAMGAKMGATIEALALDEALRVGS